MRQVSLARDMGLVRTTEKGEELRYSPRTLAFSRPLSVNGMSVRLVWAPERLHSVSPWRISQSWVAELT